jgi:lysophospholipase L1-like esterase
MPRLIRVLILAAFVVASCGQSAVPTASPAEPSSPNPSATPSAAPPSPSAKASPLVVASPSASPTEPGLSYVALGDSLLYALYTDCDGCTSAVVGYGAAIAADLKVPVVVHNLTMHNGLNSSGLLGYLEQGASLGLISEDAFTAVAGADIVTVSIGFNDVAFDDRHVADELLQAFESNLDGIVTRIEALRAGKPTLIRLIGIYNNGIAATPATDPDGPDTGIDVWKPIVEAQNKAVCRVAKKHNVECVDLYRPFNGKDGTASPGARGLLGADGVHPSQKGQDAIAAALIAAGWEPLH